MTPSPELVVREVLGHAEHGTTYLVEGAGRAELQVLKLPRTRLPRQRMLLLLKGQAGALRHLSRGRPVAVPWALEVEERVALLRPWIPGRTLGELVTTGPVPGRVAAELIGRLSNLLHLGSHAWDEDRNHLGLVHGCIHPANVILGRGGSVDLVDWGVSGAWIRTRLDDGDPPVQPRAPERVEGHDASAASDLWELGGLLDGILATSSAGGAELAELCAQMLQADPATRPPARQVARICSAVVQERSGPRLHEWVSHRWDRATPAPTAKIAEFVQEESLFTAPVRQQLATARAQVRITPPGQGAPVVQLPEPQAVLEEEWDLDDEITEEFDAPPALEGLVPGLAMPAPSLAPTPRPAPAPQPEAAPAVPVRSSVWRGVPAVTLVAAVVIGLWIAVAVLVLAMVLS